MKLPIRFFHLFLLLTCAGYSFRASSQTFDEISFLQDSRSLANGKLIGFLSSSKESDRARACSALANIQDSTTLPYILPLLKDSSSIVRRNAAFALGQIGDAAAGPFLLDRLANESNDGCRSECIDALGKCGTIADLDKLVLLAHSFSGDLCNSVALSVARFAIRKIRDSLATDYVSGLLSNEQCASYAAYALMRCADSSFVQSHLRDEATAMENRSPEVRMWVATLLGSARDSTAIAILIRHALKDPDWRVQVNSVRALRNVPIQQTLSSLIPLLSDSNEHVALTAFSVLRIAVHADMIDSLTTPLQRILQGQRDYSWRRRGEAAVLLAKNLGERSISGIVAQLGPSPLFRAKLIEALGETKSPEAVPTLIKELSDPDRQIVSAAVAAYCSIVEDQDSVSQQKFCGQILPLLGRRDMTISFSVADAFGDTLIRKSIRSQYLNQLLAYYGTLSTPDDVELMTDLIDVFFSLKAESAIPALQQAVRDSDRTVALEAVKALAEMTGKDYINEIVPSSRRKIFYRIEDTALVGRYHSALISTTEGTIRVHFRPDAAPFTVLNFILLVRRHFYDGLTFHRVVPNFVIQGGDPLGTGFGGPGYAIRTEVSPDALFTEGAVGMASAGKDTEGSQFFITHCPTPHLDGRYTVFGYTDDMNVVDKVQIGDHILAIELER